MTQHVIEMFNETNETWLPRKQANHNQ